MTRPPGRAALAALALALLLALGACGGDDEESGTTEAERPPATTDQPTATEPEPEPEPEPETEAEPDGGRTEEDSEDEPPSPEDRSPSPEDQPGGAGDEEPARSLALFTGRDGRITPRLIRVPAFISIRVELRATDEHRYGLAFDGRRLSVSGGLSSVSTTIDGLRPGEAVVARPTGAGNRVRIEATAEPGP